jgi:hypothetical protein
VCPKSFFCLEARGARTVEVCQNLANPAHYPDGSYQVFDQENIMPKYVIERELPGAGKLSTAELQAVSQKSCGVLRNLGPQIQWVQSYVTPDKIYCIYIAPNEDLIRKHAAEGGFPANRISEVKTMIDPTTSEMRA